MELNYKNYHSTEANMEYMSASQFKAFRKCEAAALAELRGEFERPKTTALLIGKYVDCHFSGLEFNEPSIFKKDGTLKAEYLKANEMISKIENDSFCIDIIKRSEKQVIKTGIIGGVKYKAMYDFLLPDMIIDLKTTKCFSLLYDELTSCYIDWWQAYGYDYQGAVYQALNDREVPFGIIAVTKETFPDLDAFIIPDYQLKNCLTEIEALSKRYNAIKLGLLEPEYCGKCDYCKSIRKIEGWREAC